MTLPEAQELVAKLFAAFPFPQQDMTVAVYVEQMAKLPNWEWALEAVNDLIQNSERLPTILALRDAYGLVREHHPLPALPLPEVPPEEVAANMARLKILTSTIGRSMDPDAVLAKVQAR